MTQLYLTRHGETEWNAQKRMQGRLDSALTKHGEEQAKRLGQRLHTHPLDVIYSSTSGRAVQTSQLIKGERDIPIILDANLQEMSFGRWEGMTYHEIQSNDEPNASQYNHFWNNPHLFEPFNGGETFSDVEQRVLTVVKRIVQENYGKSILLVSHAVVIKLILAFYEKTALEKLWEGPFLYGASLSHIDFSDPEAPKVILYGDSSHERNTIDQS
ncbi:histidine phosphatase family protein [Brevibacillus sp. SYSU BS000544]|uniref:histidine phosphatase family protein n=1 Tax=Brevibacillus sp. SYSU BS000544 TaxID=3416443 RepID=UPI003CE54EEA